METSTWRFRLREHPDPAQYVQESVTAAPYRYVACLGFEAEVLEPSALRDAAARLGQGLTALAGR